MLQTTLNAYHNRAIATCDQLIHHRPRALDPLLGSVGEHHLATFVTDLAHRREVQHIVTNSERRAE